MDSFVFGVGALDKLFPGALLPKTLVVIAGHPGAGKTTLASHICYANALKGHKCLYITFQESKEKLFRVMKSFGMDFEELERKDVYMYLRIPVSRDVESIVEMINNVLTSWKPMVIVVDSINVLMENVEDPNKRAWLQNYFYSLSEIINGVAVLIAEIPLGGAVIGLGSIEFVADAVIILKHRIEGGLLARTMEIRKMRGAPITISEFPFTITAKKGIEVFIPPILAEIRKPGASLKAPCSVLEKVIGSIERGFSIYVEHPVDYRFVEAVPLILGIALRNNLKGVYISYRYAPEPITDILVTTFSRYCSDVDKLRDSVQKRIAAVGLNPFRYSLSEALAIESKVVKDAHADVAVFHGIEILAYSYGNRSEYISNLYNQVYMFKQEQRIIARVYSVISEEIGRVLASMADLIIRFVPANNYQDYVVLVWRRGSKKPVILGSSDIEKCMEELAQYICK